MCVGPQGAYEVRLCLRALVCASVCVCVRNSDETVAVAQRSPLLKAYLNSKNRTFSQEDPPEFLSFSLI